MSTDTVASLSTHFKEATISNCDAMSGSSLTQLVRLAATANDAVELAQLRQRWDEVAPADLLAKDEYYLLLDFINSDQTTDDQRKVLIRWLDDSVRHTFSGDITQWLAIQLLDPTVTVHTFNLMGHLDFGYEGITMLARDVLPALTVALDSGSVASIRGIEACLAVVAQTLKDDEITLITRDQDDVILMENHLYAVAAICRAAKHDTSVHTSLTIALQAQIQANAAMDVIDVFPALPQILPNCIAPFCVLMEGLPIEDALVGDIMRFFLSCVNTLSVDRSKFDSIAPAFCRSLLPIVARLVATADPAADAQCRPPYPKDVQTRRDITLWLIELFASVDACVPLLVELVQPILSTPIPQQLPAVVCVHLSLLAAVVRGIDDETPVDPTVRTLYLRCRDELVSSSEPAVAGAAVGVILSEYEKRIHRERMGVVTGTPLSAAVPIMIAGLAHASFLVRLNTMWALRKIIFLDHHITDSRYGLFRRDMIDQIAPSDVRKMLQLVESIVVHAGVDALDLQGVLVAHCADVEIQAQFVQQVVDRFNHSGDVRQQTSALHALAALTRPDALNAHVSLVTPVLSEAFTTDGLTADALMIVLHARPRCVWMRACFASVLRLAMAEVPKTPGAAFAAVCRILNSDEGILGEDSPWGEEIRATILSLVERANHPAALLGSVVPHIERNQPSFADFHYAVATWIIEAAMNVTDVIGQEVETCISFAAACPDVFVFMAQERDGGAAFLRRLVDDAPRTPAKQRLKFLSGLLAAPGDAIASTQYVQVAELLIQDAFDEEERRQRLGSDFSAENDSQSGVLHLARNYSKCEPAKVGALLASLPADIASKLLACVQLGLSRNTPPTLGRQCLNLIARNPVLVRQSIDPGRLPAELVAKIDALVV